MVRRREEEGRPHAMVIIAAMTEEAEELVGGLCLVVFSNASKCVVCWGV